MMIKNKIAAHLYSHLVLAARLSPLQRLRKVNCSISMMRRYLEKGEILYIDEEKIS